MNMYYKTLPLLLSFFDKNKWYSFIQIDRVYQYNTNLKQLKKMMNLRTKFNSIKRHSTCAYKYDYIQATEIFMFLDLQN